MHDYNIASLKKDFPILEKSQNDLYLCLIFSHFIDQLIPAFNSWLKDIATDVQHQFQAHHSPNNFTVVRYVIDGKIHSLILWSKDDGVLNLWYAKKDDYLTNKNARYSVKTRDVIRFEGPSSELMFNKFSEFVRQFDLKEVLPKVLLDIQQEMKENKLTDFEGEPMVVELRKILAEVNSV